MMLVKSYLGLSEIEGFGVFASEFIPRGAQLWGLNPKFDVFVDTDELARLPQHMQEFVARYAYPHLELPGVLILDSDHGKFMNHSERPNTDFTIFDRGYALCDIAENVEITCNYAEFDPCFSGFRLPGRSELSPSSFSTAEQILARLAG